jgi:hypothetical protein
MNQLTKCRQNFFWAIPFAAIAALMICLITANCYGDETQNTAATASNTAGLPTLINNFANWTAYGFLMGVSAVVFVLWIVLSWAVLKLYGALGTYILPIWDFSSGPGTQLFGQPVPQFQCVDPNTASTIGNIGFVFFCVATVLIFVIVSMDAVKVSLSGEDAHRLAYGFSASFAGLLLFPWIYTGLITFGNITAQMVQSQTTSHFSTNSLGIARSLYQVSIFGTMDSNTQANLGVGANSGLVAAVPGNSIVDPNAMFSQLFSTNGSMWNMVQVYVAASPEMYVSRLVQIVFCLMTLIEIVMIFMLKGAQVAGIVINYFLGILACSLLASPKTRPMFWQWFKNFLELCLWGFVWALLLMATWITLSALGSSGLTGFDNMTPIGFFLLPFILFGTIKKFTEVASILSGISVSGHIATNVGKALHHGFTQGAPMGADLVSGSAKTGAKISSKWIGSIADRASSLALAVPGIGQGAAYTIQIAGNALGEGAKISAIMGGAMAHGTLQPSGRKVSDGIRSAARFGANFATSPVETITNASKGNAKYGITEKIQAMKDKAEKEHLSHDSVDFDRSR